jgi:hypothetical protein
MSQMQLFDYSTLAPELQVEVKTATERIKLRMKRTAEDIIEIGKDLIAVKEKLPHGKFLPWITSEFEMSHVMATKFMQVAERFNGQILNNLIFSPTTLYELAAPSTPDEVVEQVMEKAENGETVTAKEVKELKEQLRRRDQDVASLQTHSQLLQDQLIATQTQTEEQAQALAEEKIAEIEAEYEAAIERLEKNQLSLMDKLKDAEESYFSELEKFKKNPDPETKGKLESLQAEYKQLQNDAERAKFKLEQLQETEHQAFTASLHLERFFGDFNKVLSKHPEAVTSMASSYLPDSSLAKLETMASTFDYWAETIRKSVFNARSGKANPVGSSNAIQAFDIDYIEV